MKKLLLVIGLCVVFCVRVYAGELSIASPAGMAHPTDEINSSFSQSKNTNWFIHRITPRGSNKEVNKGPNSETKPQKGTSKSSFKDRFNSSDDKLIKQINEESKQAEKINKNEKPVEKKEELTVKKQEKKQNTVEKKQETKEKVHTIEPAEKVIKQEEKEKDKEAQREQERQQYRELEALTIQYKQAVALYTDNNLDESLAVFSQIPDDKRPAEAWLLMGNILMDKGKKDEAVFMYGRAILTDSKYYKAYYNLGNVYLDDEKVNMAIEQYKMAIKYAPNNSYIFYNLGCAYIKTGELKKAKTAFIKAIELNNLVPDFHYNLAYVYKKLGKEKLSKTYIENYNKITGEI